MQGVNVVGLLGDLESLLVDGEGQVDVGVLRQGNGLVVAQEHQSRIGAFAHFDAVPGGLDQQLLDVQQLENNCPPGMPIELPVNDDYYSLVSLTLVMHLHPRALGVQDAADGARTC